MLAAPRLGAGATDPVGADRRDRQGLAGARAAAGAPAARPAHRTTSCPTGGPGIAIGVDEELAPVLVDLAAEPHLICFADAESGKTGLLRLLAKGITAQPPERARVVLVDPRRTLLGAVPATHLIGYTSTAEATAEAATDIAASLRNRLPGPEVTARELRERSWWTGPDVYLLVDDYDLVAPGGGAPHPLLALSEFLPQAKDVGLHVVLARPARPAHAPRPARTASPPRPG